MSRMSPQKTALYTAIVTPLDSQGAIHFSEFERLLRDQERAANGVVILGSTGEGLALTDAEKKQVVQFTSGLNLQVPVLTGVAGFQLAQTKEFLAFCESQPNIDGYLMPVPLYAKPGVEGQTEWFTSLLDSVSRPSMIYNIPSRSGVKLHNETLSRIARHANTWAVKESSGSVQELQSFRAVAPNLAFYCGDDALLPSFSAAGAVGLVSVASNVWPEATHRYVDLCLAGKGENLLSLWKPASDALFTASNPVPVKALLQKQGRISLASVRPPLSARDLKSTEQLETMNAAIQNWHAHL